MGSEDLTQQDWDAQAPHISKKTFPDKDGFVYLKYQDFLILQILPQLSYQSPMPSLSLKLLPLVLLFAVDFPRKNDPILVTVPQILK
jgi:hypothetical protein